MTPSALLAELEQEAAATRRVLERVTDQHLSWRPNPKAMSLGQLALHVATIPGTITHIAGLDGLDASTVDFEPAQPGSAAEILPALDGALGAARAYLAGLSDAAAATTWTLTAGEKHIFTMPRAALLRALMLNHWYHHRGQMVVYFRCLDLPVPAVYGRSADEGAS